MVGKFVGKRQHEALPMSKKQHHPARKTARANPAASTVRDWNRLAAYNRLEPSKRAAALPEIGITDTDPSILGILTKSHFVIPGETRFECQRCGECCRYARKVAQLTYEPCLFLTADNSCAKHDNRYLVCKWFPFWIYSSSRTGPLLTIKPYCTGFGKGPIIDYGATLERIAGLAAAEASDSDGAFVIHEVLMIPGRKDWAFPSRANIDALMSHILMESRKLAVEQTSGRPTERADEVHYAHHYTSGLLGSINDPLLTINEQQQITDTNAAASDLFKRERSLVCGRTFSSFFVNPDRVAASIAACFTHGKETASAQRLRLPDESTLPVLLNGVVYRDRADGLVHGSLVCLTPVSAAVFNEVSQSRTYARGLLEASLDALMVIDRDGVITDVNEMVVTLSGQSRDRLIGSPFKDLFVDREKAVSGVNQTFEHGTVRNFVLSLCQATGKPVPVSFNATVYRDSEGVVQGIFAAARDIRERLAMTQELEDAKNYARGLIECCIDLMVTINRDGIITDANNAASTMTGLPRERIIGAAFDTFFDNPEKARRGVELTFSDGTVQNYRMNLHTAAGKIVPVSFNATLYRDSAGIVQGVFAIARVVE
jgi:PAS domain S-box-containing protein